MKISRTFSALLLALVLLAAPAALLAQSGQQPAGVPAHPRELKYTTLTYTPPKTPRSPASPTRRRRRYSNCAPRSRR